MSLFERSPQLYVIGDIHGCKNELVKLFEWIDSHIQPGDIVVCLGDYVDRGPDSKGVIDLLIERQKNHPNEHVFLYGNHEDLLVHGVFWLQNGGDAALASYGIDPYGFRNEKDFYPNLIPHDHKEFIDGLKRVYQRGKVVCVHANINTRLPAMEQDTPEYHDFLIWSRDQDRYEGEYFGGVTVIRGHTPVDNVIERKNQILLDTACVFGGKLTCCVIDPETLVRSFYSVKSENKW